MFRVVRLSEEREREREKRERESKEREREGEREREKESDSKCISSYIDFSFYDFHFPSSFVLRRHFR